jgi:hypothetical protein
VYPEALLTPYVALHVRFRRNRFVQCNERRRGFLVSPCDSEFGPLGIEAAKLIEFPQPVVVPWWAFLFCWRFSFRRHFFPKAWPPPDCKSGGLGQAVVPLQWVCWNPSGNDMYKNVTILPVFQVFRYSKVYRRPIDQFYFVLIMSP